MGLYGDLSHRALAIAYRLYEDELSLGRSGKYLKEPFAVRGTRSNFGGIDPDHQVSAVPDLMIPALGGALRRSVEDGNQLILGNLFDVPSRRQDASLEPLPIVAGQGLMVAEQPGFHGLDHQMEQFLWNTCELPSIAQPNVLQCRMGNRPLGIHKKEVKGLRMIPQSSLEAAEGILTRATRNDTDSSTKKPAETFPDPGLGIALVTASFYVEPDLAHQRLPPISPILHNSPRV